MALVAMGSPSRKETEGRVGLGSQDMIGQNRFQV